MAGNRAGAIKGWLTRKAGRPHFPKNFGGSSMHTLKLTAPKPLKPRRKKNPPTLKLVAPNAQKPKATKNARKSSQGYERWKAELESIPKRFPLGGPKSTMTELNRFAQAHPGHFKRYLKEHPAIDKHGRLL